MFEESPPPPPRKRHTSSAYEAAYGSAYGSVYGSAYNAADYDENQSWQPMARGDTRGAQVRVFQDSLGGVVPGSVPPGMRPLRGVSSRRVAHAQVSDGPQVSYNQVFSFRTTSFGSEMGVDPWSESAPFPNTGDFDRSRGANGQESSVQVRNPRPRLRDTFSDVPASTTSRSRMVVSPPVRVPLLANPNLALTPVQPASDAEEEEDDDNEEEPMWQSHMDRWFQNLAASTQKRYRVIINNFIQYLLEHDFAGRPQDLRDVNNVTLAQMQRWIASFGDRRSGTNSNSMKRKHAVCIKSFWKSLFYHWQVHMLNQPFHNTFQGQFYQTACLC